MAESTALLVDDVLQGYPIRQWVLSLPIPLRLLLARNSSELSNTQRAGTLTPYRDGTTHVFFDPIDFIGKLVALIPPLRLNLTRFYGVFAPTSNVRAKVTASQHSTRLQLWGMKPI